MWLTAARLDVLHVRDISVGMSWISGVEVYLADELKAARQPFRSVSVDSTNFD
jgi:hypothetical protein